MATGKHHVSDEQLRRVTRMVNRALRVSAEDHGGENISFGVREITEIAVRVTTSSVNDPHAAVVPSIASASSSRTSYATSSIVTSSESAIVTSSESAANSTSQCAHGRSKNYSPCPCTACDSTARKTCSSRCA
ncbi:unnamed protein product [Vitrella brassicaformis CCMP3155]|uniref:Uncharacterized protein n=1 Tax=Vitrella brassicaformis (strain CCMP3155) TaxID=1169540 RepID=A0A0G4EBV2_VITBC|nr:unnamed protein product [Vitrella brassicaformis CCMP3155]|eukprot:CEL92777.1 unnamed protein product [Vitrella brassicaformis CCMP3155]